MIGRDPPGHGITIKKASGKGPTDWGFPDDPPLPKYRKSHRRTTNKLVVGMIKKADNVKESFWAKKAVSYSKQIQLAKQRRAERDIAKIKSETKGASRLKADERKWSMNKEEVLQELSPKTLASYITNRSYGMVGNLQFHPYIKDPDIRRKINLKARKGLRGIEQASKKLAKEEVELNETKALTPEQLEQRAKERKSARAAKGRAAHVEFKKAMADKIEQGAFRRNHPIASKIGHFLKRHPKIHKFIAKEGVTYEKKREIYASKPGLMSMMSKLNKTSIKPGSDAAKMRAQVARELYRKKAEQQKEETVTELKKSTYGSYINKAANSIGVNAHAIGHNAGTHPNISQRPEQTHLWKKMKKRVVGVERATDKLTKEETVTELKKSTYASYIKKAGDHRSDHDFELGIRQASHDYDEDRKTKAVSDRKETPQNDAGHFRITRKRARGIDRAVGRLTKEELLPELKLQTYKNYYHKVKKNPEAHIKGLDNAGTLAMAKLLGKPEWMKKKATKEETVNELKKSTLGSYIKKATQDLGRASHNAALANDSGNYKNEKTAEKRFYKRYHGIERATDKLAKEAVIYPKGPKQPLSPEIQAQVKADMAKRKAAHHKLLKGVKKEVDKQIKSRKPIHIIRDPMDESMKNYHGKAKPAEKPKHDFMGYYPKKPGGKSAPMKALLKWAKKKGVKEETLQELDKRTMSNYVRGASNDIAPLAKKVHNSVANDRPSSDISHADYKKLARRGKGIATASAKMAKTKLKPLPHRTLNDVIRDEIKKKARRQHLRHVLRKKGMKEETVNELKKSTYGSYINKASNEVGVMAHAIGHNFGMHPNISQRPSQAHVWRKMRRKAIGIGRATDKLTKEETVTELKKSTYVSYLKKAHDNEMASHRGHAGTSAGAKKDAYWAKSQKRRKGQDAARSLVVKKPRTEPSHADWKWPHSSPKEVARNKKYRKEEVVSELKKSTYASYIKKSADAMRDLDQDLGSSQQHTAKSKFRRTSQSRHPQHSGKHDGPANTQNWIPNYVTASRRERGIGRAADRLAKEETVVEGSPRATQTKKGLLGKSRADHLLQVTNSEKARGVVHSNKTDGRRYGWIHTTPYNKGPFETASERHKREKMTQKEEVILEKVSKEEAQKMHDKLGFKFDLDQFHKGMNVELEHKDVTHGDLAMTAKIAAAHLKEKPDYYTALAKMEKK